MCHTSSTYLQTPQRSGDNINLNSRDNKVLATPRATPTAHCYRTGRLWRRSLRWLCGESLNQVHTMAMASEHGSVHTEWRPAPECGAEVEKSHYTVRWEEARVWSYMNNHCAFVRAQKSTSN